MTLPRPLRALTLLSGLIAAPLGAQLAPLTVPKGLLRLDFGGRFDNWDRRYIDGVKLDAGSDAAYNPFDGRFLVPLDSAQAALRRITGVAALGLSLGRTSASMLVNVGTGSIGAGYGLTSRLTIFGTVPIVRVRVQNRFDIDTVGATAGINPANPTFGTVAGAGQTSGFLAELQAALTLISARLTSGAFDANPSRKALAQQILSAGTPLNTNLRDFLPAAAFLPVAGSTAAGALTAPIESLRGSIQTLAEPGVSLGSSPALPTLGPTSSEFEGFATNPLGPLQSRAFSPAVLQYIGDIEVGAAFAWLDHRPKAGGFALRSVLVGTVRLRTGQFDRADSFFDLGTGDRQPDVQGDLVTDLARGGLGARLTARYVLQLSGRQERRLSPPEHPFALASTLAAVEWNPGEIVEGSVEPFLRIAPTLALSAGVRYRSKGADRYSYVRNQTPIEGTSPDVLAIGSKQNLTTLYAGLNFSHDGARRDGTRGLPMEAWLRWETVAASSAGRVPASQTVSLMLRFYRRGF
jgi:hypothetical protein